MMVPAIPYRAAKLFQLLDFCVGGAVLMYRLTGATLRDSAERATNRGAARNMISEKKINKKERKKKSRVGR